MITENRLNHIIGVARRCYNLAKELNKGEDYCRRMYVMGFLHDVGYEFSDNQGHASCGADILEQMKFPFSDEIRKHGMPLSFEEQSEELRILNQADIETSATGERIFAQERLQDVEKRYGRDSVQYTNMEKLCKELNLI